MSSLTVYYFVIFLNQLFFFACHCAGNWMSKLSSQRLKGSTVLLFSSQAAHIAVYCLSSSTRGNRYDLACVACKAETPILDNCSEMCLCRGAWGNKLTTNIITVLVEHWRKFYMEKEGDREAHRGRQTMKLREQRERAYARRGHSSNECLHWLFYIDDPGVHTKELSTTLPSFVLFNLLVILKSCLVK